MLTHMTPRLRPAALAVAAVFGLAVAACGGAAPTSSADTSGAGTVATDPTVAVLDDDFDPAELTVEAGTAVRWNWEGDAQHNVVGPGFESEIQANGTFAHTFDRPGTYTYVCTLHQGMVGTVVVVGA